MTFSERFFKNRIKPIIITQMILGFPVTVFFIFSLKSYPPVKFFYSGLIEITFALYMFLSGIEQYILKKKILSITLFVLSVIVIIEAVQTFSISQIHK
ncbi:hypothetical protein [Bacillus sp. AFS096315]|uniref:hypothetical protein n=1 Tax=Bacillus sp. AFS096315 TaxID=2033517 RepID=UPI000BEE789C|nr:hypothetical protein [Bacillus sp. AFS096315]PEC50653.1 hypothetical protein CON00_05365 [Bacillus sp. AFS096315]